MKIKDFGKHSLSLETLPAQATFEGFGHSRVRLMNRLSDVVNAKARLSDKKPADWPAQFYDVVKGENGVTFEVGYDLDERPDGTRALKVVVLKPK